MNGFLDKDDQDLVPEKLFSTGEVMRQTNLSRQTLHNYKRMGLITVVKQTENGRCFYGPEVFGRIRQILVLQRHRSLAEIRDELDGIDPEGEPTDDSSEEPADSDASQGRRSDDPLFRIGDLSRETGISRQTLHNYTIQGLIQARTRTEAGHRLYGVEVFERLRRIERYKRHHPLDEVQQLLERDPDSSPSEPNHDTD